MPHLLLSVTTTSPSPFPFATDSYAEELGSAVQRDSVSFRGVTGTLDFDSSLGRIYDSSQYHLYVNQIREDGHLQVQYGLVVLTCWDAM